MKPFERQALLDRVDREGATVGVRIPERLELQGGTIALRDQVFELQTRGVDTDTDRAAVDELRRRLRRARLQRVERLETADISYETGQEIADTIVGIDRALAILDGLGTDEEIEARMENRERADQERWMKFLKRALGQTDDGLTGQGGYR